MQANAPSPVSQSLQNAYQFYRRLPSAIRVPLRTVAKPRWTAIEAFVRLAAKQQVAGGPFRGMTLFRSVNTPPGFIGFLSGTYEIELADVVERIVARGYRTIVNGGAADGYYAVGLALRSPATRVIAFEADPKLHAHLDRMARANGVERRIEIRGRCEAAELTQELERAASPALVLTDIEGGEATLLDPDRVPALRGTDMLVETHDSISLGCTDSLIERFSQTHDIERIRCRPRVLADLDPDFLRLLRRLAPGTLLELMDERRGVVQEWLFLTAKGQGQRAQSVDGAGHRRVS